MMNSNNESQTLKTDWLAEMIYQKRKKYVTRLVDKCGIFTLQKKKKKGKKI